MLAGREVAVLFRAKHERRLANPFGRRHTGSSARSEPRVSKDGKTPYYLDAFQKLMAVDVDVAGDSLRMGPPRTLFQTGIRHSIPTRRPRRFSRGNRPAKNKT